MQWLSPWDFWKQYNTTYYPAQKSLLAKRPFPPEMTGFQKQFADGARSLGTVCAGAGADRRHVEPGCAASAKPSSATARPCKRPRTFWPTFRAS